MVWVLVVSFVSLMAHVAFQKKMAAPGIMHAAVWLFVSSGYIVFQSELDVMSTQTVFAISIGIALFSIGLYLGSRYIYFELEPKPGQILLPYVPALIVLLSSVGLMVMTWKALQYVPMQPGMPLFGKPGSWYGALRDELFMRGGGYGVASYMLNFSLAGISYLILEYKRNGTGFWLWPIVIIAIGMTLLTTGRTFVLLLICITLGVVMQGTRYRAITLIAVAPLIFAVVFVPVAILGGRLSAENFIFYLKMYSLAPISAYDYLVNAGMASTDGSMTFRTPLAVLRALGVPVHVPDLVQSWAPTRIPGNVYTVFSPYFRDFGLLGVGGFMLMLGTVHGWVYRQMKFGHPVIIVANAILFYALLMQFFQDQYFSLLSQWVQILFWIYLFNKLRPLPNH